MHVLEVLVQTLSVCLMVSVILIHLLLVHKSVGSYTVNAVEMQSAPAMQSTVRDPVHLYLCSCQHVLHQNVDMSSLT